MKRKIEIIIGLCIAILLTMPISGFALEFKQDPDGNNVLIQPFNFLHQPKIPGEMSYPYPIHDISDYILKISNKPDIKRLNINRNSIIEDIILQTDEDLILGYLTDLVAFGPRVTETTACEQAGEWIYNEFEDLGLDVRYHNWSNSGYTDRNIEATLPGADPNSDEIYIICGHYDTVSGSPGADDDGSGTVAALAAAYILKQYSFDHTIRFVAFSGEEQGLLGSEKYVEDAYNNGDNIVATLNVDMIGFALTQSQGNQVKVYHNDDSNWLVDFTDDIAEQYNDLLDLDVIPSGFSWGSDHYYFWEYGYDALFYHEYEFNHYYHSSQDTIATMNMSYDVKCTQLIFATLATLCQPGGGSTPPEIPSQPNGPNDGIAYKEYTFTTSTTDPDSDQIYYKWDWGDEYSDWEGPYDSGVTIESAHYWKEEGTYEVRVKAKDANFSSETDWSEPSQIQITGRPKVDISIQGGLGIKATIENIVDVDLNDLSWSLSFDGGLIIIQEGISGIIENIAIGDIVEVQTERLIGIGLPQITISVDEVEKTVRGLIFGPIIIIIG